MSDSRRRRMSGGERREQLLGVGRALFAERGFDGTSVEEIAAKAKVSKPVVYEHFGGKEGLYAVVVDREMDRLLKAVTDALTTDAGYRRKLELGALALLEYIEESTDGFRILVRDSHAGTGQGSYASLLSEIAAQVEHLLGKELDQQGYDEGFAAMYAQMLVGMIAMTGQWWLETSRPRREDVAAHVVNLAWNGLGRLEARPGLDPRRRARERERRERRQEKAQAKAEKARERALRRQPPLAPGEIAPLEA
ncbi:TetR/AcrR family transcriptional regulator [Actinocorallia libanotica]